MSFTHEKNESGLRSNARGVEHNQFRYRNIDIEWKSLFPGNMDAHQPTYAHLDGSSTDHDRSAIRHQLEWRTNVVLDHLASPGYGQRRIHVSNKYQSHEEDVGTPTRRR